MHKEVTLDVRQIRVTSAGIENLVWPVSRDELSQLEHALMRRCLDQIKPLDCQEQALGLTVLPYFLIEAIAFAEASLLIARFRERGKEVAPPPSWRLTTALKASSAPSEAPFLSQLALGPPKSRSWRVPLRRARDFFIRDAISRRSLSKIRLREDIVSTVVEPVVLNHAACIPDPVAYVRYESWFDQVSDSQFDVRPTAQLLAADTAEIFAAHGVDRLPLAERYLARWLTQALSICSSHLRKLHSFPTEVIPAYLWTGTGGNVWARLLRQEVRRRGGLVTGHDHAIGTAHRREIDRSLVEFFACDHFVTLNQMQAKLIRESLDDGVLSYQAPIKVSPRAPAESGVHTERSLQRPRRNVKRIMVLTTIYRGDRYHNATVMPDLVAVDFQARLFCKLREWGYEVFHKHHPASYIRPPGEFEKVLKVVQVSETFESVLEEADGFLIVDDSNSSVIGPALASDKPVTLIDLNRAPWTPEAFELLQRRCGFVRGDFDQENRVVLDWELLREALIASETLSDPAIFDSFFRLSCPQGSRD